MYQKEAERLALAILIDHVTLKKKEQSASSPCCLYMYISTVHVNVWSVRQICLECRTKIASGSFPRSCSVRPLPQPR